jgi:hypothetical protein
MIHPCTQFWSAKLRASLRPRSAGLRPPVFEPDDAVEAAGEVEIVGGDQRRQTGMADEVEERIQDAVAGRVIEIAGRLVSAQDFGGVGRRADDRDPLLLAAREPPAGARREADAVDESGVS